MAVCRALKISLWAVPRRPNLMCPVAFHPKKACIIFTIRGLKSATLTSSRLNWSLEWNRVGFWGGIRNSNPHFTQNSADSHRCKDTKFVFAGSQCTNPVLLSPAAPPWRPALQFVKNTADKPRRQPGHAAGTKVAYQGLAGPPCSCAPLRGARIQQAPGALATTQNHLKYHHQASHTLAAAVWA
eukprot:510761-Pelagomonas_calceolata.AAC.1